MPVFRPKEFLLPKEPTEALSKLRAEGKKAHVIAGGTGFYELAKRGYIPEVKNVVSIMKLGLDYLKEDSEKIAVGATITLQKFLESGLGNHQGLEAIGDSLCEIRPIQVRNVATVGGEVCISVPIVDLPTALLACDASVVTLSEHGESESKLEDFYIDAFLTKLKYGEIVKEISLPLPRAKVSSAFAKIGRTAYDFNLVNAAVALSADEKGRITFLRAFLGGIKRTPIRAKEFERKLFGKSVDEGSILDAARSTLSSESFLPSVHGSSEYKHEIMPVLLRDCTLRALDRSLKSGAG